MFNHCLFKARERKVEEHRDRLFRGDRVNFTGKILNFQNLPSLIKFN